MIEGMERKICGQENESGSYVCIGLSERRGKNLRPPSIMLEQSKALEEFEDSQQ